ncbi:MAG: hypothetical protein ACLUOF_05595 [Ruminococcus sp.]
MITGSVLCRSPEQGGLSSGHPHWHSISSPHAGAASGNALRTKLEELRYVSRAKCLLIVKQQMTEKRRIATLKNMDTRTRKDVAMEIIAKYEYSFRIFFRTSFRQITCVKILARHSTCLRIFLVTDKTAQKSAQKRYGKLKNTKTLRPIWVQRFFDVYFVFVVDDKCCKSAVIRTLLLVVIDVHRQRQIYFEPVFTRNICDFRA